MSDITSEFASNKSQYGDSECIDSTDYPFPTFSEGSYMCSKKEEPDTHSLKNSPQI